jgi:hypothetical protein
VKKPEWEQDIVNRQRNIVFPDTMLNEGRFYRNLASAKRLSPAQKIGCAVMSLVIIAGGAGLALQTLDAIMHSHGLIVFVYLGVLAVSTLIVFFGCMAFYYCFVIPSTRKHHRKAGDLQHSDKF